MKRLLNTLYVTTEGAWLRKDGANVVVEQKGEEIGRAPLHLLGGVVCVGQVGASPQLLGACAEQGLCVTFLTDSGRFLARIEGPVSGNVLLRRAQHRATIDPAVAGRIAAAIVAAKCANQRLVLQRAFRDHGLDGETATALHQAAAVLEMNSRRSLVTQDLDTIRGLEGDAGAAYFAVFDRLILPAEPGLRFRGRSRRPPLDPPNALLSFLYVLLTHDCRGAAEAAGLDPQMGFLHRDRPGRASLALDLVEELRAPVADRVALNLLNRKQVGEGDFIIEPGGAVRLTDEARKTVIVAYQERKREDIVHPFLGERVSVGHLALLQARLLAHHLRGDLDGYPPFLWR